MKKQMTSKLLVGAVAAACAGSAAAFTFSTGEVSGTFNSSVSLGTGVRADGQPCGTVIGTVGGAAAPATGAGAPGGCLDAVSMYNDQGNLNYNKGDAFTTYLKGTHELFLKMPDEWKFFGRINWVKDFSATHTTGVVSGGNTTGVALSGDSSSQLNFKARLLDFWVSKQFDLNGEEARIRVGNQVISWGESLFLPGGINQTNAMDLMRLSQPGTQLKEVYLPAPIISAAAGLGHGFNIEGYVQTDWNKDYFPPVGSYWSIASIGNGADSYGAFGTATAKEPRNGGQYGLALRYQPESTQVNFGLYAMRYHDKAPVLTYSQGIAQYSYLEDRTLLGVSTNFPLGDWAIGSELSYRPKDAVSLQALPQNGADCLPNGNCYVDQKKYQMNLTGILSMTPSDYGGILKLLGNPDTATLLAEAAVVDYPDMQSAYQGIPVASGYWGWGALTSNDTMFTTGQNPSVGTPMSWGYNFDFSWTYDGSLIHNWQVTPEVYYFQAVKGRTPNAMGLFMQGAKSANFIVTFTHNPANWSFGMNYAKFWGGSSVLDQPLTGRNFYGAYVTRNF